MVRKLVIFGVERHVKTCDATRRLQRLCGPTGWHMIGQDGHTRDQMGNPPIHHRKAEAAPNDIDNAGIDLPPVLLISCLLNLGLGQFTLEAIRSRESWSSLVFVRSRWEIILW